MGILLIGVGFGLTALVATLPLLAVTVAVWTLGEIIYIPVAAAHVANIAPKDMRGRYQGAWGLTFGLGVVAGPARIRDPKAVTPTDVAPSIQGVFRAVFRIEMPAQRRRGSGLERRFWPRKVQCTGPRKEPGGS